MNNTITALQQQIDTIDQKIEDNKALLNDSPELAELIQEEIDQLNRQREALVSSIEHIQESAHPSAPTSDEDIKDAIIEIRAAAGGDEAGLFASEMYRMYLHFAENQRWKTHQLQMSSGGIGNVKEVSFEIIGKKDNPAYPVLQFESGVHRVQRVPQTESSGRIHTSTITVAVLPKVTPQQINIDPSDLKIDTFRSSGPGGQSVNTTDSAVRITHVPTGVTVSVQDEKSQHKNREKAMEILSSRLFKLLQEQQASELHDLRLEQIGTGERSEKIRTYNFPQDRVTDHRINQSWHNINAIMDGEIEDVVGEVREELGGGSENN